jgi:hypothetical protein
MEQSGCSVSALRILIDLAGVTKEEIILNSKGAALAFGPTACAKLTRAQDEHIADDTTKDLTNLADVAKESKISELALVRILLRFARNKKISLEALDMSLIRVEGTVKIYISHTLHQNLKALARKTALA